MKVETPPTPYMINSFCQTPVLGQTFGSRLRLGGDITRTRRRILTEIFKYKIKYVDQLVEHIHFLNLLLFDKSYKLFHGVSPNH